MPPKPQQPHADDPACPTPNAPALPPLPAPGWFGPALGFDLIRQARRPRAIGIRFGFALCLFGLIALVFLAEFSGSASLPSLLAPNMQLPQQALTSLTDRFVALILTAQGIVLALLTPAYVGGCIAEERQRRTLDLLFTTQLTDRELLLGKLTSRLVQLFAVWIAGLPILALMQLWGGVNLISILFSFAATALTVVMIGAVSLCVSTRSESVARAVGQSYLAALMLSGFGACLFTPLNLALAGALRWSWALLGLGYPLLVSAVSLGLAWRRLRPEARDLKEAALRPVPVRQRPSRPAVPVLKARLLPEPEAPNAAVPLVHQAVLLDDAPPRPARRSSSMPAEDDAEETRRPPPPLPPLTGDPVVWKDMHLGVGASLRQRRGATVSGCALFFVGFICFAILMMLVTLADDGDPNGPRAVLLGLARVVLILSALVSVSAVLFSAARSIVSEKEADTLLSLLTTPYTLRRLLWAKWRGALLRHRLELHILLVVAGSVTALGLVHPASAAVFLLFAGANIALAASLGLFISQGSRTLTSANFTAGLLLVLLAIAFSLLLAFEGAAKGRNNETSPLLLLLLSFVDPMRLWWETAQGWPQWNAALATRDVGFLVRQLIVLPSVCFQAFLAFLLFQMTVTNLRRAKLK